MSVFIAWPWLALSLGDRAAGPPGALMPPAPLVQIPEERKQQELRRAIARAGVEDPIRARLLLLAVLCLGWLLLGFALLGLSFHLTDPDRAQVALLAAILVGNGGPAWTLLLSHWLAHQR